MIPPLQPKQQRRDRWGRPTNHCRPSKSAAYRFPRRHRRWLISLAFGTSGLRRRDVVGRCRRGFVEATEAVLLNEPLGFPFIVVVAQHQCRHRAPGTEICWETCAALVIRQRGQTIGTRKAPDVHARLPFIVRRRTTSCQAGRIFKLPPGCRSPHTAPSATGTPRHACVRSLIAKILPRHAPSCGAGDYTKAALIQPVLEGRPACQRMAAGGTARSSRDETERCTGVCSAAIVTSDTIRKAIDRKRWW